MQTTSPLVSSACCILLSGCMNASKSPVPIVVVSPSPSRPHLILTADRATLRHGETVKIIAIFVNPTRHQVALPTMAPGNDKDPSIEHYVQIDWKGENGNSSSGISTVGISTCPPSIDYLAPKTSRSHHLEWKFDGRGKGIATLTYTFGHGDDFPPAAITIATR